MLTGFFLTIVYGVSKFMIDRLPVIPFPDQIPAAILFFWGAVNTFSVVTPVSTLVVLMGLTAIADSAYLVWLFIHWVARRFRH